MEEILLACGLSKETVIAIMMLHKDMKLIVHSPNSHCDFLDIVTGVLQGDIFALILFIVDSYR